MSYVYLISDGTNTKIGKADVPTKRLLSLQTGNASKLELLTVMSCSCHSSAYLLERTLHGIFSSKAISGEWFLLVDEDLALIKSVYESTIDAINGRYVTVDHYRIGNGTMNKDRIQSIDLLREMTTMTKAEQFVIMAIKDALYWDTDTNQITYIAKVPMRDLTKSQTNAFTAGYKLLFGKHLVRRVKQSHYMINPNALIPTRYEDALAVWDKLNKSTEEP